MQENTTQESRRSRETIARLRERVAQAEAQGASERRAARTEQVPRSTLRYWDEREARVDASDAYKAFFESPEGVEFIHRLVVALHVVMELVVGGGIRPVILILELTQLMSFVAGSIGTHHEIGRSIEREVGRFGRGERQRLAGQMMPKTITVCQDETFHPETCLVVIEPVSNFILAEKYAEHRDAQTWNETMKEACDGIPVTVAQSTSDEAKGILGHARQIDAHHSPDVFHVQHEASKALSLPLAHRVKDAEQTATEAQTQVARVEQQEREWASTPHGPGRPPNFQGRKAEAEGALVAANLHLEQARARQERGRRALRGIGRDYHPVDLATGDTRSAEQTADKLKGHFDALRNVAEEAQLSERSFAGLKKAERVLPAMKSTLTFFHEQVGQRVTNLDLTAAVAKTVTDFLVPAAYLERAANRASRANDRDELRATAHERRTAGRDALTALGTGEEQCRALETDAAAFADIFQRASSCVEGRNGQLSLRHHHLHSISPQRLEALTVIHNYFIRRPDRTTAAERFFGVKPYDLFEHLLTHISPPPRPAAKRPREMTLH